MKLAALFLIISLPVAAHSYSQNVTMNYEGTMGGMLKEMEQQTGYRFTYSNAILNAGMPAVVRCTNKRMFDILDEMLPGKLAYRVEGDKLIVIYKKENQQRADTTVRGRVTGKDDAPLPGVTVSIKGQSQVTTTDAAGMYSIQAGKGQMLVFTYVGYEEQQIIIGDNPLVNISLLSKSESLNDVVVIGYGTQRKASVTAAVSSVTAKDLKNQVTKNVLEAMASQMPGVDVKTSTGRPGSNPVVRIRGTGSLNAGNEPLYVVDGMPLATSDNINLINPNDIETIDVLKDASAGAIYGSRGGNGVVLITTKKGKAGQSKIEVTAYSGVQDIPKKIDVLNRDQHIQFWKELTAANWAAVGGDPNTPNGQRIYNGSKSMVNYLESFDNPSSLPDVDWQDWIFNKNAMINNLQASAQGGTEKVRYFVSGNYFGQEGLVKATDFKRYTARMNLDASVTENVRVGMTLSPSYSKENRRWTDAHINSGDLDASAILSALVQSPTIVPKTASGLYDGQLAGNVPYTTLGYAVTAGHPLQALEDPNYKWYEEGFLWLGSAYGEIDIIKGLTLRSSYGIDSRNTGSNKYRPSTVSKASNPVLTPWQPNPNIANILSNSGFFRSLNYTWDNTLTFHYKYGDHDFNVLAGYSAQKYRQESTNVSGTEGTFQNDQVQYVTGTATITGSAGLEEWSLLSYLGRINYDYQNKYLLSAAIRRDGSSRFAPNNKWATFPSVSLGWRLSEEGFLKNANISFLDELKLRASYGETGNFNIGNYRFFAGLSRDNYSFGGGMSTGYAPGSFPNYDLTWETNQQKDLGIDIGLFRNRLRVTVDYYHRITNNLLYNIPIPSIAGQTSVFGNIGKVQNRGFEFMVNAFTMRKGDFQWTTTVNLSTNRNKVLQVGRKNEPVNANSEGNVVTQRVEVGKPIGVFYGYAIAGVFMNQKDLDDHPEMRFNKNSRAGDTKFVDVNGDDSISAADRTIIGDPNPDFTYGITNHFSYKGFDLDVQLQGVQGNDVFFLSHRFLGGENLSWNQLTEAVTERWKSEAEPGKGLYPRAGLLNSASVGFNESQAARWLRDGSYLRIRNVTLGYNVPGKWVQRAKLASVRVYGSVQNLYTFSKYIGYDPDVNTYGENVNQPGIDYNAYPLARTFTVGLNVGLQ